MAVFHYKHIGRSVTGKPKYHVEVTPGGVGAPLVTTQKSGAEMAIVKPGQRGFVPRGLDTKGT